MQWISSKLGFIKLTSLVEDEVSLLTVADERDVLKRLEKTYCLYYFNVFFVYLGNVSALCVTANNGYSKVVTWTPTFTSCSLCKLASVDGRRVLYAATQYGHTTGHKSGVMYSVPWCRCVLVRARVQSAYVC